MFTTALASALLATTYGCSNFMMDLNSAYRISGRSMDLGGGAFGLLTVPITNETKYGYIGFEAVEGSVKLDKAITGGMNEKGLSCDMQTLDGTQYPQKSTNGTNVLNGFFCSYILARFASTAEVALAMPSITVWGPGEILAQHFVLRDAEGASLVLEWIGGVLRMYVDKNDDGKTGFGVFTNEPEFPYHVANVRHLQWKRGLARQAVTIPGTWYPEERFMRLYMVKSAMQPPTSLSQAVSQAVHVLNTVTVPMGAQYGTDSGHGSGEGSGDHTLWAAIYDHNATSPTLYWRTAFNQNLQRLQFSDVDLKLGATELYLPVVNSLPWFNDARSSMVPRAD